MNIYDVRTEHKMYVEGIEYLLPFIKGDIYRTDIVEDKIQFLLHTGYVVELDGDEAKELRNRLGEVKE